MDLPVAFSEDKVIIINNKSDSEEKDKQIYVNSLEAPDDTYRIIFIINMLNEGWVVRNLFDIVRLDETSDGNNGKSGKTTISEAQLIGCGASIALSKLKKINLDLNVNMTLTSLMKIEY